MSEQLSRRAQIRQMRHLARSALAEYDLGPTRLTLLAHMFNTTFRVDTDRGERYVLRIHRAGARTVESVGSELAWLEALRRDTNLDVPAPVPTRASQMRTIASAPDVPTQHICVLFRWLDGRRVDVGLTPTHLERAGELMARLQDHAMRWQPPSWFTRSRVDWPIEGAKWLPDPFAPQVVEACRVLVADSLSAEEAAQVVAVIKHVRVAEQALGKDPDRFGLIHADMHQYNLLFSGGTVRAIDFDDCGFGPLLYDLAVPLSMLQGRARYPALRAALLAGYRRVRPLPLEQEIYLDMFIALRHLQDALWVLERRPQHNVSDDWVAHARRSLAFIGNFLAAGSRFPN